MKVRVTCRQCATVNETEDGRETLEGESLFYATVTRFVILGILFLVMVIFLGSSLVIHMNTQAKEVDGRAQLELLKDKSVRIERKVGYENKDGYTDIWKYTREVEEEKK